MSESPEDKVAAAVIERALTVYERLKELDHAALTQARKLVTTHVYGMIAAGETDEQRLSVQVLKTLKQRERELGPFAVKDLRR